MQWDELRKKEQIENYNKSINCIRLKKIWTEQQCRTIVKVQKKIV